MAAENGHATVVELLISAGATVDEANKDGRGPGRVLGSYLGPVLMRLLEGFCTIAGGFRSLLWDVEWCLLLRDPYLLIWDGFLEFGEQKMANIQGERQ